MSWTEINRYNIVNDSGDTEEYVLERNDKGTFRIRNDFGNIKIEFDSMSGVEFLRKTIEDVQDQIELDLNDIWDENWNDDSEEETENDSMDYGADMKDCQSSIIDTTTFDLRYLYG